MKFVLFVAKLFSSRHKGTKTLRKNNKIKSFVTWWQIFLGSGLSRSDYSKPIFHPNIMPQCGMSNK
jgi:hypothetical protein